MLCCTICLQLHCIVCCMCVMLYVVCCRPCLICSPYTSLLSRSNYISISFFFSRPLLFLFSFSFLFRPRPFPIPSSSLPHPFPIPSPPRPRVPPPCPFPVSLCCVPQVVAEKSEEYELITIKMKDPSLSWSPRFAFG